MKIGGYFRADVRFNGKRHGQPAGPATLASRIAIAI